MDPRERVRRLDGIVIPGGADVRPELYGQAEGEHTRTADYPVQDDFEKEIILAAISENVPMLAICRGFQLLNVAAGGTLVQDLAPGSIDHRDAFHEVDIEDGSTLERAVGSRLPSTCGMKLACLRFRACALCTTQAGRRVSTRSDAG